MIIAHSTYSPAVAAVQGEFPEIVFVFSGSGNEATGGNGFWIDVMPHEPAYLAGVAAGLMSETGKIGSVAAFPFPNVNGPVNAFFAGARSVRPDIEVDVTYIESWFDPAGAKDAGTALVNSGADSLYAASTFGTFGGPGPDNDDGIGRSGDGVARPVCRHLLTYEQLSFPGMYLEAGERVEGRSPIGTSRPHVEGRVVERTEDQLTVEKPIAE